MAFDGGFTRNIVKELNTAAECHIDKIYQPSRDELVFLLRKKGFAARMLMCARPGAARIHFTETKYENPAVAPMFCMLARKHFSGAKLMSVTQPGLERVIEFNFEATDEMGDRVKPKIICELIGNQTNIILIDGTGRIIDAVRRSDIETAKRLIQPGAIYEYPEKQDKLCLADCDVNLAVERIMSFSGLLSKAIISSLDGLSPLVCREVAFEAYGDDIPVCEITDTENLKNQIELLKKNIIDDGKPTLLLAVDDTPSDFTYIDIAQYGSLIKTQQCESFSSLLDTYFAKRDRQARIHRAASDILKLVNNAHTRALKRLAARKEELKSCADREQLRIYGELLKANLYAIENGAREAVVQNYYDPELSNIAIPLDPSLTPAANAAKYFKDYKKSYTAEQTLTALTADDEREIVYLESVLDSVTRCETLSELAEIREELSEVGYLPNRTNKKKKQQSAAFREYTSAEGYRILVGRNNRQNDEITTRIASKNDLWFHVKNIPGSHVVVFCGGKEVSDDTVLFAARLAAKNSKAADSSQVPVDYTPIKFVKKPNGAKPGMVIYTTNQTVFVTPMEEK